MPRFLTIISILAVSLYTSVMGYSLGVTVETDASTATSLLRRVTRSTQETLAPYAPRSWKTWQDGNVDRDGTTYDGYAIRYPRDFEVRRGTEAAGSFIGVPRVQIAFPDDSFRDPKTNYGGAWLTVSSAEDKESVRRCYEHPFPAPGEDAALTNVTVMNGTSFRQGSFVEPAAGNRYDTRLYRVLRGFRCYEVALTVRTAEIGNFTPGAVAEYDKERAFDALEKIMGTLSFTDKNPY